MGIFNFGRGNENNNQRNPYGLGNPYGHGQGKTDDQENPYGQVNPYGQGDPYGLGDPYALGDPYNQGNPYGDDKQKNSGKSRGSGLDNFLGRLENTDLGGILFIIAAVFAVGLLLFGAIKYGPGVIQSIADGLHKIVAYFKEIAVISLVIWGALLIFLGRRRLPGRSPFTSLAVIFIFVLLCQFFPDLGSAVMGGIVFMVIMFFILKFLL